MEGVTWQLASATVPHLPNRGATLRGYNCKLWLTGGYRLDGSGGYERSHTLGRRLHQCPLGSGCPFGHSNHIRPSCRMRPALSPADSPNPQKKSEGNFGAGLDVYDL